MHLQKSIGPGQPAQFGQADLGRNFLLLAYFMHIKGLYYSMIQFVVINESRMSKKNVYYIPSGEILKFPRVINFDIITSDDINFPFHFLP